MKLVETIVSIYRFIEKEIFQFITDLEKMNSSQEYSLKPIRIEEERNPIHRPPRSW